MIRGFLMVISLVVTTLISGSVALLAALFRAEDRPGSPYDRAITFWGAANCWVSGVTIVEHDAHRKDIAQHIFVSNHLGNHDIFALMAKLPWIKFVAKAELFKIPFFGAAMRAVGMIPIERANRKSAFTSYESAAKRIAAGASVAVYPEGTRGTSYALRPFKKGPFVLAIQAQAPIVPVIIHGQIEIQRARSLLVYPGRLDIHYLEPIETTGLTYDDRNALAARVHAAMAAAMKQHYGVDSPVFSGA